MSSRPSSNAATTAPRRRRRVQLVAVAALAAGACLASAPAASAPPGGDRVVMARVADAASAEAVAARTGLTLRSVLPEIGWAAYGYGGDRAAAHRALLGDPAVARIDFTRRGETLAPAFTPRDSIFLGPGTVGLDGQPVADWNWHWVTTNFPAAWDVSRGSAAVRVAVIDSEFDTAHEDLKVKLATGRNFDSGTPAYRTTDVLSTSPESAHGTHVAGLVAAHTDNGFGVSGACFDCVVIPYKVGTSGVVGGAPNVDSKFIADLTEALVEAGRSNAAVINMSLGTSRDHAPLRAAVAFARGAGKVVVASAGNSQDDQPGVLNYPGAYPGVIAVAATMPGDAIAPFSTNGDFVDIAAPGHPVLSTWDSRLGLANPPNLAPTHGVGYKAISGTSMASPIVAGLAALMRTVRPDLSPDEVEGLMEASAVDLGAVGPDPVFGAGRIDAHAALQAALAYVRPPAPAAPAPAAARRAARVFWSCAAGRRSIPAGRRGVVGVALRTRIVCRGRTAPALRGVRLQIQRYAVRAGWKRIGLVRTSNRGRFGFTRRLTTAGNWRLRVSFAGTAAVAPSHSAGVRLRALRARR